MSHLQIGLLAITGFITLVAGLAVTVRVIHPTRDEMHEVIDKKAELYQTIKSCTLFHETQDVRNYSFTNTMIEIKEEIKEIRKDIKEAINLLLKDKV